MLDAPGVYDGRSLPFVPAHLYHQCTSRVSRGQLWTLHTKSPAHLRFELDHPVPPTKAMLRGSALHTAVLEPERFAREYSVPPIEVRLGDRRTKTGKANFDAWLEEAQGKSLEPLGWDPEAGSFSRADVETVLAVAEGLKADRALTQLLREGQGVTEATLCWDEARAKYRVRYDRLNRTRRGWVGLDLKSAADARMRQFQRSAVEHGYHFQAAMYADGFEACFGEKLHSFVFVVYEAEPPYAHAFFRAGEDLIEAGRLEWRQASLRYQECMESGSWPSYDDIGIQPLELPAWYGKGGA